MSRISEKVLQAIVAKLNVAGVTNLIGSGKVFDKIAPENTVLPYVIIQRQAPLAVDYTFGTTGPTQNLESDLWIIKALADEACSTSISPAELAENISIACFDAIGTSLALTGNTVTWCARQQDMPPFEEKVTDHWVFHRGFYLKVTTA